MTDEQIREIELAIRKMYSEEHAAVLIAALMKALGRE